MRVYLIPVYAWTHPKYDNAARVAVCNRKQGFGPKHLHLEDTLGFFGGGVEEGETPMGALWRELREELPCFLEGRPDLALKLVYDDGAVMVYVVDAGVWTQAEYQRLAGSCTEGAVDAVFSRPDLDLGQLRQHLEAMNPLGFFVRDALVEVLWDG